MFILRKAKDRQLPPFIALSSDSIGFTSTEKVEIIFYIVYEYQYRTGRDNMGHGLWIPVQNRERSYLVYGTYPAVTENLGPFNLAVRDIVLTGTMVTLTTRRLCICLNSGRVFVSQLWVADDTLWDDGFWRFQYIGLSDILNKPHSTTVTN